MFRAASKKYSLFNPYIVKRALTFFDDVEEENGRIEILDKNFSWKKAKEKIFSDHLFQGAAKAKIMIISQALSKKVLEYGKKWADNL